MSVKNILGAYTHARTHTRRARTHTGTRTHKYTDYTRLIQNLICARFERTTQTWVGGRHQQGTENMSGFGREMSWGLLWRSPESVSVGEEREGHSMQRARRQKKCGNQHLKAWYEESWGWGYQKQSGDQGRVWEDEASHRDKTEQCA